MTETVFQRRLTALCLGFAQEVLRLLGSATVDELAELASAPVPARVPPSRLAPERRAHLASIGTRPLACRVEGCTAPGVRMKGRFCLEHAATLSDEEKARLRGRK